MERLYLNLPMNKKKLYIIPENLKLIKETLEKTISENSFIKTKNFSNSVLFGHEIKTNNTIEGYNDNIEEVRYVIRHKNNSSTKEKRILNLYKGYKYILKENNINKDNLRELYSILSEGLLDDKEIETMGDYYRLDPVYIFYSNNIEKAPDIGLDAKKIDEYMNYFFEFVNSYKFGNSLTDEFIKSQIMHFYFVYIHPYYDINGRTSRTTSMWYLINQKAYPYIIFNRAIQINKTEYYKVIREAKQYSNATFFVKYMMDNVDRELTKESIIHSINNNVGLNYKEYQTLYYILSMNGLKSVNDFANFYNRYNDKLKNKKIYEEMILPLINKKVILSERETNKNMFGNNKNIIFKINDDLLDKNKIKIK